MEMWHLRLPHCIQNFNTDVSLSTGEMVMLTPLSITLTDFKCFTQTVTFDFPTDVGLYFVTGQNQVNPELEANGCGKSTIFCDAPCWCLYGKTPRGLKAGDVINWNSATARVDFKFGLKDHTYRVVRSQSPNSIIYSVDHGDLKTITQIELDDLLGLSYDAFCKAVLFAQFGETFFDLTPTEKSELLGAVLPLEVWEQASKKASNNTFERFIMSFSQQLSYPTDDIVYGINPSSLHWLRRGKQTAQCRDGNFGRIARNLSELLIHNSCVLVKGRRVVK